MNIKRIAGHDLVPGRIIKDHIHVSGTEIHVPHVIISGYKPGPLLLVTAGIHNAEYVGIQAAIELSSEIDPEQLTGTLVIVPVANRSGFENRTMSMVHEDGKNLNRVFPGDDSGTAADRLAHLLFNTFIKYADAYVDLHSGDGYEELIPYVYYVEHEWYSPATGCWYPEFHSGDTFLEGEKLGTIRDYFGKMIHEITATEAGTIIHQCASLNILKDGPMISYGAFK